MGRNYVSELGSRTLIFDGGNGVNLQRLELATEDFGGPAYEGCLDYLCLTRPDVISALHHDFLDAGCDVVETNTFQASRLRLEEWGLAARTAEINQAGAFLARAACDVFEQRDGRPRFVSTLR